MCSKDVFKGIDERDICCAKNSDGSIQSGISFEWLDESYVLRFHFSEYVNNVLVQSTKLMYLNDMNTSELIKELKTIKSTMTKESKDMQHAKKLLMDNISKLEIAYSEYMSSENPDSNSIVVKVNREMVESYRKAYKLIDHIDSRDQVVQIDSEEWLYKGCFIQESEHPQLFGKYEVFKNDKEQTHVGRTKTFSEAKKLCEENECFEHFQIF